MEIRVKYMTRQMNRKIRKRKINKDIKQIRKYRQIYMEIKR